MNIKLQTNEQLSATVANGLAGVFVNGVSLSASLSGKADLTALQNYYAKSETSSSSEISNELKKYQLSGNYYQKSETSSANEISTALENAGSKVYFDNRISGVAGSDNLSVVRLSANEYAQMLDGGTCLSNAIYIVEAPNIDAFKRQIKNVAPPTDLSDAATKEYVDNKVSSIHIPADLSAFSNSPGYLVSNDVKISYSDQTIWLSSKAYVTSVDCADFIKDGMLSTVELCGTTLVLNFNTDAGSDPVSVELSNFVDDYDGKIDALSDAIDKKVFVSDNISGISGYSDLSVIKLNAQEYSNLLTSNSLLSNALYIIQDDYMDAYGQQIKNIALPTDLSDAATKGYVDDSISNSLSDFYHKSETSSANEISIALSAKAELSNISETIDRDVVPAIFKNVQLVKPRQPEGHRLHFRGDIARDDQFEDIVAANFDSASQERWQFFKHFVVDGLSGTWETMLSTGFYTDADDVPASFYFADALSSIGETPSISSQYFLRYFWYYELSGVERRSDQFSIAIPSNTAVGANPGDVVHKDEFYDLKQMVQPFKQITGKETNYNQYYVCRPSIVTEISGALSGEFDILFDDYEAGNIYRFQFLVGDVDAYPKFYIDYGNGPEMATDLSINQDSYIFKAQTRYYAEIQNDILKVDKFGYGGGSSLPSRYKLITAELSSLNGSLCCMIEDHSITTIEISSSSTPVVVYLPEKADDGARDFIIRVEISSQTAPGFTFAGLDESMIFDSEDDDWAVLEPGLNLISFTETK